MSRPLLYGISEKNVGTIFHVLPIKTCLYNLSLIIRQEERPTGFSHNIEEAFIIGVMQRTQIYLQKYNKHCFLVSNIYFWKPEFPQNQPATKDISTRKILQRKMPIFRQILRLHVNVGLKRSIHMGSIYKYGKKYPHQNIIRCVITVVLILHIYYLDTKSFNALVQSTLINQGLFCLE